MATYYTYIHKTPSGMPFYVGKGRGNRAQWRWSRSQFWMNVVSKYGGFVPEIVASFDTEEEAFAHERFLIGSLKTFGVRLVNLTDGGDGIAGYRHTSEARRKLSEIQRGRVLSDETRKRMSSSRAGVPRPDLRFPRGPRSDAIKEKIRAGHLGIPKERKAEIQRKRLNTVGRRVICTTTGDAFSSLNDAIDWLISKGFTKASKSAITECCQGKRNTAYSMKWAYAN